MSYNPTEEQQAAIEIAATGQSCVIQALAGSGKTSTLRMIAEANPDKRFQFVAFNKAIVSDVAGSFPSNVSASTAHSLAYQQIVRPTPAYRARLNAGRMRGDEIARILAIRQFNYSIGAERLSLAPGFLAGLVKKAIDRFCQGDDARPGRRHVAVVPGIDKLEPGQMPWDAPNQRALVAHLEQYLEAYWEDVRNPAGRLPFSHGCYLKLWERSKPKIKADVILFDEAQDASPVMLSIVEQQTHAQRIYVGDSYQSIYGWTGAVDALDRADVDAPRSWLTRSFRFGPEIAAVANQVLAKLGSEVSVVGAGQPGSVGPLNEVDVELYRTNAGAVRAALEAMEAGLRVALVGGAKEIVAFAEASLDLRRSGRTYHPELSCFSSWGAVQEYVESDPQGDDLALLVKLIDEFGAEVIIDALGSTVDESKADLVLSTMHKSKGREWARVRLGDDFPDPEKRDISDEEWRLLYVAVTRAKVALDPTRCAALAAGSVPAAG